MNQLTVAQRSFSETCKDFEKSGTVVRVSCNSGDVLDGQITYVGDDFLQMEERRVPFSGIAYITPE